jgi:hypothetical protein
MADTVTTQVIENGSRDYVAKFTNLSDSTGESAVVKLDPTSSGDMGVAFAGNLIYPGTHLKIWKIWYNIQTMTVRMRWKGGTPTDMWILNGYGHQSFGKDFGGLCVPTSPAGLTGEVTFTTIGAVANASYSIVIWAKKDIAQ